MQAIGFGPNYIFTIAQMENKYTTLFNSKVLEARNLGTTMSKERFNENHVQ